jgi:ElaB/YqjD/DUF883 family membrane-anchored ribosome-binding protein
MNDSNLHELSAQAQDHTPDAQAVRDRVNQTVSSAKSAISEASEGAIDAIKNVMVSADDYVHENPWVAVGVVAGIAGAVGFLAGLVAAPRKRYFWN